ncbi:PmoA family protein [Rubripirellula amarantea]|nr:PmoA family protein [Rubripirellula amarantea]
MKLTFRYFAMLTVCMLLSWCQEIQSQDAVATSSKIRIEATTEPEGWKVFRGDEMIAGYIASQDGRPVIYPVVGPGGQRMTRDYPFTEKGQFEKADHIHHKSMWMTHGEVNGIDFWSNEEGCGTIVQTAGEASVDGDAAVILTQNDWLSPDGERVMSDTRRFAFYDEGGRRLIDCDFLLHAPDASVNFGDTKEGSFGIRVAGSMKVEADQGGIIINAADETNLDAWGKKSPWVDYSGPIDGKTVGITIHDHPSSFGYPTRWHVRTYGLFAANPFGYYDFEGGEKTRGINLPKGNSIRLNYRVVLHEGGLKADVAKKDNEDFASQPRPELPTP